MKKEEMNYEKWLEQLKKTPPVLENPDALTEDIMSAVKAAPFRNRPVRRLNFAAWCSAIAATLLLGLWVAEAVAVDHSILRGDSYTETLSRANTHR